FIICFSTHPLPCLIYTLSLHDALPICPDDRFLYRAITGRQPGTLGKDDPGTTGGVYVLDISKLVDAGTDFKCSIDTKAESENGGQEDDCPTVAGAAPINPGVSGAGPHWGAYDNFVP